MKVIEGKLDPVTGKYSFTEIEDRGLLDAHDPDACQHPNIQYFPDEFENGVRVNKHHWSCPDCDYLQIG